MSKVFVSYKHRDTQVLQIPGQVVSEYGLTTPRNYVDMLDIWMTKMGHICKAEDPGVDLSGLSPETIVNKLADRIYDSTVTLVLMSKGMHDFGKAENEQWIPWEISYSLHEYSRGNRLCATNAMIAVVLPDEYGSYNYFTTDHNCPACKAHIWHINRMFKILRMNMFNKKQPNLFSCQSVFCGMTNLHKGSDHSYIQPIRWIDFISNINGYISLALQRHEHINDYNLTKELIYEI